MDRLTQLEYPQPKLKLSVKAIDIETPAGYEGAFTITNAGGSELEGEIHLDAKSVVFYPSKFKGNHTEITYSLNLDSYKPGDVLRRDALIHSNGGELLLPITIRITPPEIKTKEGHGISSLEDFYEYAGQSPIAARQLFNQWEFADWLSGQGYSQMELYEKFASDPNKERAVDNFLTVNGIKEKSRVFSEQRAVSVRIPPGQTEMLKGEISFTKPTPGYAEVRLSVTEGAAWLSLGKDRLTSADFNAEGRASMPFVIMSSVLTLGLKNRYNIGYINAESENEVGGTYVIAISERPFKAELCGTRYKSEDGGILKVRNATGRDMMLEVTSADKNIRFAGTKYLIGKYAEIPFTVKPHGFQFGFRKPPLYETEIIVKTVGGGKPGELTHIQRLKLKIGG
jgi:hypothetical protein